MKISLIYIILSLTLISNSCEKDWQNEKTIETEFKENLRGTYLVEPVIEIDITSKDIWERAGNNLAGGLFSLIKFNITFKDNNKAIFEAFGKKSETNWDMNGNKLLIKSKSDKTQEYTLKVFDGNFNKFFMDMQDSTSNFKGFMFTKLGVSESENK